MSETQFAMISDWMVNGNITRFVKEHPDANRLELVGSPFKPSCQWSKFTDIWVTYLAKGRH